MGSGLNCPCPRSLTQLAEQLTFQHNITLQGQPARVEHFRPQFLTPVQQGGSMKTSKNPQPSFTHTQTHKQLRVQEAMMLVCSEIYPWGGGPRDMNGHPSPLFSQHLLPPSCQRRLTEGKETGSHALEQSQELCSRQRPLDFMAGHTLRLSRNASGIQHHVPQ